MKHIEQIILEVGRAGSITSANLLEVMADKYENFLDNDDLKVRLSQGKKKGIFVNEDYTPCPACGLKRKLWRLGEAGKVRLRHIKQAYGIE